MKTLALALKNIEQKRLAAAKEAENIREKMLDDKNFLGIENQIGGLEFEKARREVYGLDYSDLSQKIKMLKGKKEKILNAFGYLESDLEVEHYCVLCGDTGYIKGKKCECLKKEILKITLEKYPVLNEFSPSLSAINFEIYKENNDIYKKFAKYLKDNIVLKKNGRSLFTVFGKPGIGKTYITGSALRQCLDKGDNIVFINAIKLNKLFLQYHCADIEKKAAILEEIDTCDILLIDDLGAEQILNNVTIPYLYELIIERIGKKTIITTNLSQRDLENRYGQRIFSRLMDKVNSAVIMLKGEDLRLV